MRRLCATVLVMEAIVIGLAIPVAITIGHGTAGRRGGRRVLAVAAVLLAGLVGPAAARRVRWWPGACCRCW